MDKYKGIKQCIVCTVAVVIFFAVIQIGTNIANASIGKNNMGGSDGFHQLKINKSKGAK